MSRHPSIRRRSHNRSLRRASMIVMATSFVMLVAGMLLVLQHQMLVRGLCLTLLALVWFGNGAGLHERQRWAWSSTLATIAVQAPLLLTLSWPLWWVAAAITAPSLLLAGYLLLPAIRYRLHSSNRERRSYGAGTSELTNRAPA